MLNSGKQSYNVRTEKETKLKFIAVYCCHGVVVPRIKEPHNAQQRGIVSSNGFDFDRVLFDGSDFLCRSWVFCAFSSSYREHSLSAVPINVHDMRKFIEDALTKDNKEDGYTLEEVERIIRCDHQDDFDPKTDLSIQLKLALKRGVAKGRYMKFGRFYKVSPKTVKTPKVWRQLELRGHSILYLPMSPADTRCNFDYRCDDNHHLVAFFPLSFWCFQ